MPYPTTRGGSSAYFPGPFDLGVKSICLLVVPGTFFLRDVLILGVLLQQPPR